MHAFTRLALNARTRLVTFLLPALVIGLPSTTSGQEATPATAGYASPDRTYLVTFPASWPADRTPRNADLVLRAPGNSRSAQCEVRLVTQFIEAGFENSTITELAEIQTRMIRAQTDPSQRVEIAESSFRKLRGKEWWVFTGTLTRGKTVFRILNYKTIHNSRVHMMTYACSEANFQSNVPAALAIVESFDFLMKERPAVAAARPAGARRDTAAKGSVSSAPRPRITRNVGVVGGVSFRYGGRLVSYGTVVAADGRVWLRQSLGSLRVAQSIDDRDALGHLFQWGRWDDGHQVREPANTRVIMQKETHPGILAKSGTNPFYYALLVGWYGRGVAGDAWDAASADQADAHRGADPCRQVGADWRLPTKEEWEHVQEMEQITDANGAFQSNLRLAGDGYRDYQDARIRTGTGHYWSSNAASSGSAYFFVARVAGGLVAEGYPPLGMAYRGMGLAVRCIKAD